MREFGHNLTIFQENSSVTIKYEKFEYHLPILQKSCRSQSNAQLPVHCWFFKNSRLNQLLKFGIPLPWFFKLTAVWIEADNLDPVLGWFFKKSAVLNRMPNMGYNLPDSYTLFREIFDLDQIFSMMIYEKFLITRPNVAVEFFACYFFPIKPSACGTKTE